MIRQTDESGFEEFFRTNQRLAYRIAFAILRKRDLAEDAVTDGFIRIYNKWNQVKNMDNPQGYLARTVSNRAKTLWVKNVATQNSAELDEEAVSGYSDPETKAVNREQDKWLEKALETLKSIEREIIYLKDLDGLKFEEVASLLNMNLSTVKSHYRRAKLKLTTLMEDYDGLQ
jgi:RNA polymerase sigma-70 factor (ECF subfamily)